MKITAHRKMHIDSFIKTITSYELCTRLNAVQQIELGLAYGTSKSDMSDEELYNLACRVKESSNTDMNEQRIMNVLNKYACVTAYEVEGI